ncbi:MAG: hypothetical protein DLM72_09220 [Candidatus Nitrosopolaris wilkensis]|nr:MAG: hypothetical protein DLM72_09220 [Candidatus Nitrosopolaris wilkensis]
MLEPNSKTTAAMATVERAMLVFEFIVASNTLFLLAVTHLMGLIKESYITLDLVSRTIALL